MSYAYDHLNEPRNTTSGVADSMLIAPLSAFQTLRCPEAPFTNPGDEVTIRRPHVFKANEGFIMVQLAPEKNNLALETIGNKGFQKFNENLNSFIAGSYKEVHEAIKNWMNKPHIVLIRDSKCEENLWYQVGCECEAAYLMAGFDTGNTAEGDKGYTCTWNVKSDYVALYAPLDTNGDPINPLTQLKA